ARSRTPDAARARAWSDARGSARLTSWWKHVLDQADQDLTGRGNRRQVDPCAGLVEVAAEWSEHQRRNPCPRGEEIGVTISGVTILRGVPRNRLIPSAELLDQWVIWRGFPRRVLRRNDRERERRRRIERIDQALIIREHAWLGFARNRVPIDQ